MGRRKWTFYGTTDQGKKYYLYQIGKTPIVRHSLTKKGRNPYLPEFQEYFELRAKNVSKTGVWSFKAKNVGKKTNFVCKVCNEILMPGQELDIHHVLPKKLGGTDSLRNLIILHRECHKQVTNTKNAKLIAQFLEQGILKKSSLWNYA